MTAPFHWGLVLIALVSTLGSILTRADPASAVPLAAMAVAAAGVAFWDAVRRSPHTEFVRDPPLREAVGGVRVLFREGRSGREGIVLLIDALERKNLHPELPARPAAELRRLADLPIDQFRRRVAARLDEIETSP